MTNQINNKYFKKFCENLEALGLTYEEVERDYKYSGGNLDEDGCETRHSRYFDMCFLRDPFPDKVKKCMCDHPIVENCFISKDFDINTLLIIGNCCIKRFIKASSRTCENCNAPHKNRSLNYCNDCKEYIKRGFTEKCISCHSLNKRLSKTSKCESCNKGFCFTCNKKIDSKYKKCYSCNLIKK
jgi:hypothetical protein